MRTLAVVIPAHNEEEILAATTEAVLEGLRSLEGATLVEVILSENGSTDRTKELAKELAAQYPLVRAMASSVPDYGLAMRRGFEEANAEFVVNFDADYYDFDFVRAALECDADIVVAAKNIAGSNDDRDFLRRTISVTFSRLVRTILGINTTETHGMKLYRMAAIAGVIEDVVSSKDLFDTELIARAELAGLRVVELPITTREMRAARSSIFRRIPRTLAGLLRLRSVLRSARSESRRTAV